MNLANPQGDATVQTMEQQNQKWTPEQLARWTPEELEHGARFEARVRQRIALVRQREQQPPSPSQEHATPYQSRYEVVEQGNIQPVTQRAKHGCAGHSLDAVWKLVSARTIAQDAIYGQAQGNYCPTAP